MNNTTSVELAPYHLQLNQVDNTICICNRRTAKTYYTQEDTRYGRNHLRMQIAKLNSEYGLSVMGVC